MLSCDQTLLLVVDVQGRLAKIIHDQASLFTSHNLLIKGILILDIPILWMEQIPSKLGLTVEEIRHLKSDTGLTPIEKDSFSCFNE